MEPRANGFLFVDCAGKRRLDALASGALHLTHTNSVAGKACDSGSSSAPQFRQASSRKQARFHPLQPRQIEQ